MQISSTPEAFYWNAWHQFFAFRDAGDVPSAFLDERPGNEPLTMRNHFGTGSRVAGLGLESWVDD